MLEFPRWRKIWLWALTLAVVACALPSFFAAANIRWPDQLPEPTVNLGLDLAGGSHILLEAEPDQVAAQRLQNMEESVRQAMRDASPEIRIGDVSTANRRLSFMLDDSSEIDRAREILTPLMNGTGPVRALTPETRRSTRLENGGDCVPTLAEVLAVLAPADGLGIHAEIKLDEKGDWNEELESALKSAMDTYAKQSAI